MTTYTVYAKNKIGEISPEEEEYTNEEEAEVAAVEMAERMGENWQVFIIVPAPRQNETICLMELEWCRGRKDGEE
jgi:hypothetical protein